jgi:hypothetical protein
MKKSYSKGFHRVPIISFFLLFHIIGSIVASENFDVVLNRLSMSNVPQPYEIYPAPYPDLLKKRTP